MIALSIHCFLFPVNPGRWSPQVQRWGAESTACVSQKNSCSMGSDLFDDWNILLAKTYLTLSVLSNPFFNQSNTIIRSDEIALCEVRLYLKIYLSRRPYTMNLFITVFKRLVTVDKRQKSRNSLETTLRQPAHPYLPPGKKNNSKISRSLHAKSSDVVCKSSVWVSRYT